MPEKRPRLVAGGIGGIILIALVPVLLVATCIAGVAFTSFGLPIEWEIPEGHNGWVALTVGDPSCPPLRRHGLTRAVSFDPSGRACTSDRSDDRFRSYSYVFVAADGRRTPLRFDDGGYAGVQASHPAIRHQSDRQYPFVIIYIGTYEEGSTARSTDIYP